MSAPNFAWDGYTDAEGISNSFIEPTFDNPRRIHTPNDDRGPRPTDSVQPRSPEQVLAAHVLYTAWQDATGSNFLNSWAGNVRGIRREAWAFLTAKMPDPRAARRQLFASLLDLDDDILREAAERRLGKCPSVPLDFNPIERIPKGSRQRTEPPVGPGAIGALIAEARQRRDTQRPPLPIDNAVLRHAGEPENKLPPHEPKPCVSGTSKAAVLAQLKKHPKGLTKAELHALIPTIPESRIVRIVCSLRRELDQPIVTESYRYRLLSRAEWVAETNSTTAGT